MAEFVGLRNDILQLADDIDGGNVYNEHIVIAVEEYLWSVSEISAVTDTEVDKVVWNNFQTILHCVRQEIEGRNGNVGRPSIDIPIEALEAYSLIGVKAADMARLLGVSTRTIRRRMEQHGLR